MILARPRLQGALLSQVVQLLWQAVFTQHWATFIEDHFFIIHFAGSAGEPRQFWRWGYLPSEQRCKHDLYHLSGEQR